MKAIQFTNWTKETFIGKWDKVDYPIKPGASVFFDEGIAKKFARDLAIRELNKKDESHAAFKVDPLVTKALSEQAIESENATELQVKLENENKRFCDHCDSKGGRHKRECPTQEVEKKEEDKKGEEQPEFN